MSNKIIIGILVVLALLILGAGVYFATIDRNDNQTLLTPTPEVGTTPIQSPQTTPENGASVPDDWEIYTSTNPNYSISYPTDMRVENPQDAEVRFIKLGPTQTQGTELFDGISLSIDTGSYDQDFRQFVQDQHQESVDQPITENVTQIQSISLAGVQGFQFRVTSLGEFTHVYLPMDDDTYMHLYYLVADPENQGFEETKDIMLSSIEF